MAATQEETNFYRSAEVVLDVSPKILREMLASEVVPNTILTKFTSIPQPARKMIRNDQITEIHDASMNGTYDNLDTTLLYFLLRNLSHIVKPTNNWGLNPSPTSVLIGDDVERIRITRNTVCAHAKVASVSGNSYKTFITDMTAMYGRFDNYLQP